jgi:hypothetical protein
VPLRQEFDKISKKITMMTRSGGAGGGGVNCLHKMQIVK